MRVIFKILVDHPDQANAIASISSAIIALFALISSFVAVYISYSTVRKQQKHNVLSVKPFPMLRFGNHKREIEIILRNSGVGPLIMKDALFYRDKEENREPAMLLPKLRPSTAEVTCSAGIGMLVISPNEWVTFIKVCGTDNDPILEPFLNDCRVLLSQWRIKLKYSDIYGTKFEPVDKTLSWYSEVIG